MFDHLFDPRGIVVYGATENPIKLGYGVVRNLIESNYQGKLSFVNPRGGSLFDHRFVPDLVSVPDPIDLALILIPAHSVPEVLVDCGERGVPFAIISSSGFKETGAGGKELTRRCLEIAEEFGIRILGPNCVGIMDTHLPLNTTFLPSPGPVPGEVAFISHSGAACAAAIDWTRGQGIGFSRLVSLGNQMDIHETDLLQIIANDANTRIITMYLESIGDGLKFVKDAKLISTEKPILALKAGKSDRGQEAVVSHTGALAGHDRAFNAAFEKAGVIRAERLEEMFDWAKALAWCPLPRGRRVAVLTNAGGFGVIAMDALVDHGMIAAEFKYRTMELLAEILPPEASMLNPVDMLASAGPPEYAKALSAMLEDDGVDSVLLILPPPPIIPAVDYAFAIIPIIQASSKPVLIALMGDELINQASDLFRQAKIPDFRFAENAASALGTLARRAEHLSTLHLDPVDLDGIDRTLTKSILEDVVVGKGGFLDSATSSQIISSYGINTPETSLVFSPEEASEVGKRVGYPLVLKLNSPDKPHKSDIDGVVLGLYSKEQLNLAFSRMMEMTHSLSPETEFPGILVQKMVKGGQEVIVGVERDFHFGPLVMFGSGGVEVEEIKDVAFMLAPLSRLEAEELIDETWAGRKLLGYRNIDPADREAVIDTILRIGQLVEEFPQILELEINPLIVLPEGNGSVAVDVRLKIDFGDSPDTILVAGENP